MTEERKGIFALVLLSFTYATFGVTSRLLSLHLALFQQIYLRNVVALFLAFHFFGNHFKWKLLKNFSANTWILVVCRSIAIYIGVFCYVAAVLHTQLGNVAMIAAMPYLSFWGVILFREKLNFRKSFLILVSIAGVVLISLKIGAHYFYFGSGELLALVSGLSFNLGVISRRWFSTKLSSEFLTQLFILTGIPFCILPSLIAKEPILFRADSMTIIILLIAGSLVALNIFLANYSMVRVEAIFAGNILTLESVFGVLLGFALYNEIPSVKSLLGGCLIILSAWMMNRTNKKKNKNF